MDDHELAGCDTEFLFRARQTLSGVCVYSHNRLLGFVVKVSALRAADLGLDLRLCRGDFCAGRVILVTLKLHSSG